MNTPIIRNCENRCLVQKLNPATFLLLSQAKTWIFNGISCLFWVELLTASIHKDCMQCHNKNTTIHLCLHSVSKLKKSYNSHGTVSFWKSQQYAHSIQNINQVALSKYKRPVAYKRMWYAHMGYSIEEVVKGEITLMELVCIENLIRFVHVHTIYQDTILTMNQFYQW